MSGYNSTANKFGLSKTSNFSGFETTDERIKRLLAENTRLSSELFIEKQLREEANKKAERLEQENIELKASLLQKRKRRTKAEMELEKPKEVTKIKSNGVKKASAADPIKSYDDFRAIQTYFLDNNKIRDWTIWTVGVSLGIRVSDLVKLKIKYILNDDMTFKDRIEIIEQKTSKAHDCLITDAVKQSITKYLDSLNWEVEPEEYLFRSNKSKGKTAMAEEYCWRLLSDAGKSINLNYNIGSHTMRKSFANIVACTDKSTIDMNMIVKIQGLLNHSDPRVTMKYLGTLQDMYDRARISVSDFVLGKLDVNELIAGTMANNDDILGRLENIENLLNAKR